MAATWEVEIAVADVANQVINVTATRTDGTNVRTYALSGLSYVPTAGRTLAVIRGEIAGTLYGMYQTQAEMAAATAAIANQEALIAAALNAKEA
jgi:hypothetical protein